MFCENCQDCHHSDNYPPCSICYETSNDFCNDCLEFDKSSIPNRIFFIDEENQLFICNCCYKQIHHEKY